MLPHLLADAVEWLGDQDRIERSLAEERRILSEREQSLIEARRLRADRATRAISIGNMIISIVVLIVTLLAWLYPRH